MQPLFGYCSYSGSQTLVASESLKTQIKSEKVKVFVAQLCSTLWDSNGL